MVVEGINAIPAALKLAKRYRVDMPIIAAVDAVVNKGDNPAETVRRLMVREQKNEISKSVLDLNFEEALIRRLPVAVVAVVEHLVVASYGMCLQPHCLSLLLEAGRPLGERIAAHVEADYAFFLGLRVATASARKEQNTD